MYYDTYVFIYGLCFLFVLLNIVYFVPTISRRPVVLYKKFIIGSWRRSGVNASGESWNFTYSFTEDSFEMTGVPEYHVKGKYKIAKEIEKLVILQLYQIEGISAATVPVNSTISIAVDRQNNRIVINDRSFDRVIE